MPVLPRCLSERRGSDMRESHVQIFGLVAIHPKVSRSSYTMNSYSGAKAVTQPSHFRPWHSPTAFAQDEHDSIGYSLLPTCLQQYYLPPTRTNPVAHAAQLHISSSSLETSNLKPRSIVELAEVAEQSLDDVFPFNTYSWLRMAEKARRDAEIFHEQGEVESAFIEFTKAVTIVRDKIPPDYRTPLISTGKYNISTVSYHFYSLAHLLPLP